MSRILIWRKIISGDGVDIFSKTDYAKLDEHLLELYGGTCPNWGNKLWYQGLYSEIDTSENEITIRTDESIDEINNKYDLIIYPMANFFSEEYASDTSELVNIFRQIRIPTYIIACGAQAKNYGDIENLIQKIGDSSRRFIETVYKTGGEFALRGYFTKEFFDRLGFPDAVVTGCPSLFQVGRDFQVEMSKVSRDKIKPIINGDLSCFDLLMNKIPESIYLSQDQYEDCLYRPSYFEGKNLKSDILFSYNYSIRQAELLGQGRIKMIVDLNDWYQYIRNHKFNFAFGTKLHGSIMSILAGVPAVLVNKDSRTMEVAEYFDIPTTNLKSRFTLHDYYQAYNDMDYSLFNKGFKNRFEAYEQFLVKHKIVNQINEENRFFKEPGLELFEEYCKFRLNGI